MSRADEERIALVTGATSGIGAAISRRLLADGCKVVAVGRRRERLEAMAGEFGESCWPLALDVSDAEAAVQAIASLPAAFREVSVLVNGAGMALGDAPAQEASLEDWQRTIRTNVDGVINMTHALLPQMVRRNRGDIVNIGSIAASYPYPKGHVYGASKAFVRQFTLNLKADLLGTHVRATCIEPATVETEFAYVRLGRDAERAKAFYAHRDLLQPDDVAEIVAFVIGLPSHVNINTLEVMSTAQGFAFPRFAED